MAQAPESGPQPTPDLIARTAPIIAIALVMGVSTFLAIALFFRSSKGLFAPDPWDVLPPKATITLLGLVFGAVLMVASYLVPRQVVANMRKVMAKEKAGQHLPASDPGLYGMYQMQLIIGLALLEGGAFFNTIAFLLEGHAPSLIMVFVLLGLILSRFPTRLSIDAWVEDQRMRTLEERNFT